MGRHWRSVLNYTRLLLNVPVAPYLLFQNLIMRTGRQLL